MKSANPLYVRLLRLRSIHPSAWQRAALFEGVAIVGIIGALADKWSAWTPVVLPLAVALVVKFHDVVAGALGRPGRTTTDAASAERDGVGEGLRLS